MPKIELTNEQKNIPKTLLLCSKPNCDKNEKQPGFAIKLCPFCCKIGYCSNQCLISDLSKHLESGCTNNINTVIPISTTSAKNVKNKTKLPTTDVNEYISDIDNSDSSSSDEDVSSKSIKKKSKSKSKINKSGRYKNK